MFVGRIAAKSLLLLVIERMSSSFTEYSRMRKEEQAKKRDRFR